MHELHMSKAVMSVSLGGCMHIVHEVSSQQMACPVLLFKPGLEAPLKTAPSFTLTAISMVCIISCMCNAGEGTEGI